MESQLKWLKMEFLDGVVDGFHIVLKDLNDAVPFLLLLFGSLNILMYNGDLYKNGYATPFPAVVCTSRDTRNEVPRQLFL